MYGHVLYKLGWVIFQKKKKQSMHKYFANDLYVFGSHVFYMKYYFQQKITVSVSLSHFFACLGFLNLIYNIILKLVVKQSNNIIFKEEWEEDSLAPLPCCIAAGPDSSENTKWILYHAEIYIIHLGFRSKCHVLTLFHSRFNL